MTLSNHPIFIRHASIGRPPTRHSGAVPRRDRHPGSIRSAPAPGGSGTLTRHSGSLCSDSGRGYPESPPSKPQTDNFRDVMHGTKAGDSGYFTTLPLRKIPE